jgi:hypothetical protein
LQGGSRFKRRLMAKHTILPKHRQFLLNPPTVALNFEVGRSPFVSATLENRAPQVGPPVCARSGVRRDSGWSLYNREVLPASLSSFQAPDDRLTTWLMEIRNRA